MTYTPEIRLPVTVNPHVRDEWLRRYAVGAPYTFMFDPYAPDLPLGMPHPPFVRQIRIAFLACLGSLLISTAMVYVGKNKAI